MFVYVKGFKSIFDPDFLPYFVLTRRNVRLFFSVIFRLFVRSVELESQVGATEVAVHFIKPNEFLWRIDH